MNIQTPVGGLVAARAETSAPTLSEINASVEELMTTVKAFQDKNDERLKAIEANKGDVLDEEHVTELMLMLAFYKKKWIK